MSSKRGNGNIGAPRSEEEYNDSDEVCDSDEDSERSIEEQLETIIATQGKIIDSLVKITNIMDRIII